MTHPELDSQAQLFEKKIKNGMAPDAALNELGGRIDTQTAEFKSFLEASQEKYPEFVAFFKGLEEKKLSEFMQLLGEFRTTQLEKQKNNVA